MLVLYISSKELLDVEVLQKNMVLGCYIGVEVLKGRVK